MLRLTSVVSSLLILVKAKRKEEKRNFFFEIQGVLQELKMADLKKMMPMRVLDPKQVIFLPLQLQSILFVLVVGLGLL